MQFVCVYYSTEVSNGNVLKLNGMVEWERANGNCEGGFSVDSYSYIVFSFVYGHIKVVYCVAPLNYEINKRMSCPKIINASQAHIHQYKNWISCG